MGMLSRNHGFQPLLRGAQHEKGAPAPIAAGSNRRRPHPPHQPSAAFTKSAARSPIMMLGALVLPLTSRGMILASATHSPSMPFSFNAGSTTASASFPIRHVPTG